MTPSLSRVIDDALSTLRAHPWVVLAAAFVFVQVPSTIGSPWLQQQLPTEPGAPVDPRVLLLYVGVLVMFGFLWCLGQATVANLVDTTLAGRRPVLGSALRTTLGRVGSQGLAFGLAGIASLGICAVVTLASLAVAVPLGALGVPSSVLGVAIGLLAVLAFPAFFAVMLVFPAAIATEGVSAPTSLRRSWELTRGARGFALAVLAAYPLLLVPLVAASSMIGILPGWLSTPLLAALGTAFGALCLLLQAHAYFALRSAKEGYDLEVLARRAEEQPEAGSGVDLPAP